MVDHTLVNMEGRGTCRLICTSPVLYMALQCSTNLLSPPRECENSLEVDMLKLRMRSSEPRRFVSRASQIRYARSSFCDNSEYK